MVIANCKRCRNVFDRIGSVDICPQCREEEEIAEETIKNYLRAHPGSSWQKISQDTGIKESLVLTVLQKGSFESSGFAVGYPCQICGREIVKGRLCKNCSTTLLEDLKNISERRQKKSIVTSSHLRRR